ncbi:MAG: hypothetical protein ACRDJO_01755, partial [Actinomycetota bacterium]
RGFFGEGAGEMELEERRMTEAGEGGGAMQVANGGRIRTYGLDERTTDWQLDDLLQRIDELETKNGLLRAKLMEARDNVMQLEMQNRDLRDKLFRAASALGAD